MYRLLTTRQHPMYLDQKAHRALQDLQVHKAPQALMDKLKAEIAR